VCKTRRRLVKNTKRVHRLKMPVNTERQDEV
jgi:hypothetical protein